MFMSKHYFYSLLKALAVVQILLCVFYSLKLTRELRNKTQAISQLNYSEALTWIFFNKAKLSLFH